MDSEGSGDGKRRKEGRKEGKGKGG